MFHGKLKDSVQLMSQNGNLSFETHLINDPLVTDDVRTTNMENKIRFLRV